MDVGIAGSSAAVQATVKVAEKQEDQNAEVSQKLIESTESSTPSASRDGFGTGTTINAEA